MKINNLKKIGGYGNLASVVGSMIIGQPELINTIVFNQTAINNRYLNFSQEQEIEADFYAVDTLNNLNLPTNSIKEFLLLLENKTEFDTIDEELKKFSTHPLFKTRYEIIDLNENLKNYNYDLKLENEFNFIKAKFMAYTNKGFIKKLKKDQRIYYDSIKKSKSGSLIESLKILNLLIPRYDNNIFLLETKADILLSYGYNKEATEFYKKILINQPDNKYAKYNIFVNIDFKKDENLNEKFFFENQVLLNSFPYNKTLITKLYSLSKILELNDWISFFEAILFNKNNLDQKLIEIKENTKDYNLKKLIKLYT